MNKRKLIDAVIARLGQAPRILLPVSYPEAPPPAQAEAAPARRAVKGLVGVDVFVHWNGTEAEELAALLEPAGGGVMELAMITNRGVKVWPGGLPETFCTDHWRCRFVAPAGATIGHDAIVELLSRLTRADVDVIKTETLCTFDGERGYALGQGQ